MNTEQNKELNDIQLERIDEVYAYAYDVCLAIEKNGDLEEFASISYTGPLAEYATACLVNAGYNVYFPYEESTEDDEMVVRDYYTPEDTDTSGWRLTASQEKADNLTDEQKAQVKRVRDFIVRFCRFLTEKEDMKVEETVIDAIAEAAVDYLTEEGYETDYPAIR